MPQTGDHGGAPPGLILELQESVPPARLGSWLVRNRAAPEVRQVWRGEPAEDGPLADRPYLAVLGSASSVYDDSPGWIEEVRAVVEAAVADDVPTLGICFGAQMLSTALGGSVSKMPSPEVEWREVETRGDLVPTGPWIVWHYDSFTVPPGGEKLAWTSVAPLGFRAGRHLGVQFHPEATPTFAARWVEEQRAQLSAGGVDPDELAKAVTRVGSARARAAAESLFSAWWRGCVAD